MNPRLAAFRITAPTCMSLGDTFYLLSCEVPEREWHFVKFFQPWGSSLKEPGFNQVVGGEEREEFTEAKPTRWILKSLSNLPLACKMQLIHTFTLFTCATALSREPRHTEYLSSLQSVTEAAAGMLWLSDRLRRLLTVINPPTSHYLGNGVSRTRRDVRFNGRCLKNKTLKQKEIKQKFTKENYGLGDNRKHPFL